jgi:hypothetical protein
MYIRIKTLKNQKYAYLVKNKRYKTKPTPKQKTIKYLGRVHTPFKQHSLQLHKNLEFYFKNNNSKQILKDLIILELKNHNFKELPNNIYKQNNLTIDLNKLTITNTKNNIISLEINEGFLNNYTLNELFKYKHQFETPLMQQGTILANLLISAGIKIDEEIFLRLFEKIHKQ